MGIEDTASKSLFSKSSSLKNKSTVFTIGNRGDILSSQLEAPIIVPHAHQKTRFPFEALFRSEQYALVDNACREYLFITEFYLVRGNQAQDLFNQIMGKTMTLMMKNLEIYVHDCFDTIALFLCIQLILRYQIMCHKRCVNALDKYWDSLQTCLFPRFEFLFRLNIQSIRDCDPTKFSKETGPHYVSYIIILHGGLFIFNPSRLQGAMLNSLLLLSASLRISQMKQSVDYCWSCKMKSNVSC